eukprot:3903655-Pyramimonas_sp.AAC.2
MEPHFPSEYTSPDRVLDRRLEGAVSQYLVKWQGLGYDQLTWEALPQVGDGGDEALADAVHCYERCPAASIR